MLELKHNKKVDKFQKNIHRASLHVEVMIKGTHKVLQ